MRRETYIYLADRSVIYTYKRKFKHSKDNIYNVTLNEKANTSRPIGVYPKNKWMICIRKCVFEIMISH